MEQSNNHCSAGTNHEYILFLGDCRFVSATFRLFKLPKTGPTQKCQVIYKYFRIEDVHEYAIILHAQEIYSAHNDVTGINKVSWAKMFPRNI